MKKIFASRNVNFACQGLISSKNDAILVRNVFLIFIHHMIPIYEVIIKLTQVTIYIYNYTGLDMVLLSPKLLTRQYNSRVLYCLDSKTVDDSNENSKNESVDTKQETKKVVKPKNDFSNLFGKGSGDNKSGNGEGEGTGIGSGKGPNTGGGIGDGKGRQVVGNPELSNAKNWVGFVMVQFIIDPAGNVIETKVLYPHDKTTVTLSSLDQKFIEEDCKIKFKFTPSSSGVQKERLVKRIQYIEK